jgi:Tfp pilus assembly protein PilF
MSQIALYIFIALSVFYITRLMYTMMMYKDDHWMVEYSVMEDPSAWYAWHFRALKRLEAGSVHEALCMWVMARMLSPQEFKVIYNIASVLNTLGRNKEARQWLDEAQKYVIKGQEETSFGILKNARNGKWGIINA